MIQSCGLAEGYKSVQTQLYVGSYVPETIRSALHAQDFEAVTDTFRDLQVGAMGTMGFTSQELNEHGALFFFA
jgi:hypothetical protein